VSVESGAEQPATVRIVTGSTIVGIAVGTGLTIYLNSVEPQTRLTELCLTAVASVTLVADKLAQKFERWQERKRHLKGIDDAIKRTDDFLQNPETTEHHQKLLDKKHELQLKSIDALQYNPNKPPSV
jgi:hypothetical protein